MYTYITFAEKLFLSLLLLRGYMFNDSKLNVIYNLREVPFIQLAMYIRLTSIYKKICDNKRICDNRISVFSWTFSILI